MGRLINRNNIKSLNIFVNGQKSFKAFRVNQDYKTEQYTCQPKDRNELHKIVKERLENDPNADLNDIDTSEITDMSYLFMHLDLHDVDISDWNTSKVTDMSYMFYGCKNFTGKGLENWNVSGVENMENMFGRCDKLECDLSDWDISENCRINKMFSAIKNRQNIKLPKNLYNSKKNTYKSNGEELMWFKVWKILDENGPMTKSKVLTSMRLKPTSYAAAFAYWSSCNVIVGENGKLKALPSNEWTKEIF